MKTPKRKRSSAAAKAEPGVETSDVAAVAVESVAVEAPVVAAAIEVVAAAIEPVASSEPAGDPVIVLAANCSVKDAAVLKTSLTAIAHDSTPVTVDVRSLERIDTATMQLLCAFARDRRGRNQGVTWLGESQALQDAARLLGVRALLGFAEAKGVAA